MKDRTGEVWMVPNGGWVILFIGPPKLRSQGAMHPALMLDSGWSKGRCAMVFDYQDEPPLEESGRVRLA